ncbi:MAG: nuclear transport factor 2 family protein [Bacteroidia bacterium]|nr:nuclear transport factor 2 family protein [Bacteroidia bacterium]
MKNLIFLAVLLCAALSTRAQDATAEMLALGNAWKTAFERGDAAAVAALYSENVTYVQAEDGSTSTRTRAAVEASLKKTLETTTGTLEFAPNCAGTWLPNGKARFTGDFTQTMTDKTTGQTEVFHGSFDHLAVKENGQWKLCQVQVTPRE